MKSRESLVRLKRFQVKEKGRQLGQLDLMIAEFERMAGELDVQIQAEERKAGITDVSHFAYPTFAKAARQRRDNLFTSIRDLKSQKESAEAALQEAQAELARAEALEERDGKLREPEISPAAEVERRAMIG
jgi:flagellar export protein FliJ